MSQRFLCIIVLGSYCLGHAHASTCESLVSPNYVIHNIDSNTLSVTHVDTQESFTCRLEGTLSGIEVCPMADVLSIRLMPPNSSSHKAVLLDIGTRKLHDNRMLTLLDVDERRWSPGGAYTYFNLGASMGVVKTADLDSFLEDPREDRLLIQIEGIPVGLIFQEEWMSDRFLIIGTGQSGIMAWSLLDLTLGSCLFLDVVGDRGGGPLAVEACEPSRLRRLAFQRLLEPEKQRIRGSKYFTVLPPKKPEKKQGNKSINELK